MKQSNTLLHSNLLQISHKLVSNRLAKSSHLILEETAFAVLSIAIKMIRALKTLLSLLANDKTGVVVNDIVDLEEGASRAASRNRTNDAKEPVNASRDDEAGEEVDSVDVGRSDWHFGATSSSESDNVD